MTDEGRRETLNLKRRLAAILTIDEKQSLALIRESPEHEVQVVQRLFQAVSTQLSYKWMAPVLAGLSANDWGTSTAGEKCLIDDGTASMRYLSHELPEDHEFARKYLAERTALMRGLDDENGPYHEMTVWLEPVPDSVVDASTVVNLNVDTAFGATISDLELLLAAGTEGAVRLCRRTFNIDDASATPGKITKVCSATKAQELKGEIDEWSNTGSADGSPPASLLALVSAHLSVNRALWELCAKDARGNEATDCSVSFLGKLNDHGITALPDEIADWDREPSGRKDALRRLLLRWFGDGGRLTASGDPFFARVMEDEDVDAAVFLSEVVQTRYIDGPRPTLSSLIDPCNPTKIHGNAHNLFVFAMAAVSTFYVKRYSAHRGRLKPFQTAQEFHALNRTNYPVFKGEEPRIHTEELLSQVYGQIFFGDMRAEKVRELAEAQSVKRAHLQQVLEYAVKNRTSRQLLNLHRNVRVVMQKYRVTDRVKVRDGQAA
jgi:hypothetical protein